MAPLPWSCTGRFCFYLENGTTAKSMRRTRRRWNCVKLSMAHTTRQQIFSTASGLHNLTHITSNIIIHYIIHLSPLETLDKHTSHWSHETKVCLPRFDLQIDSSRPFNWFEVAPASQWQLWDQVTVSIPFSIPFWTRKQLRAYPLIPNWSQIDPKISQAIVPRSWFGTNPWQSHTVTCDTHFRPKQDSIWQHICRA